MVHTASPVPLELPDDPYAAVIAPAVEGTKNVFDSIMKSRAWPMHCLRWDAMRRCAP